MPALSAKAASAMASDIYLVRDANLDVASNPALRIALTRSKPYFELNASNRIEGVSGGIVLNEKSGFGIIANGVNTYLNDVFIVMRGTKTAYDWLTDANVGTAFSSSGHAVHLGFEKCFDSMERHIDQFFRQRQGGAINTVHCVGHSLGGALATLAADWVLNKGLSASVNLYTFGAPRVGMDGFTRGLEKQIANGGVYRAYHKTDPVPMVPIWPFLHVFEDSSYFLPSPGDFIKIEYHFMENYIQSIGSDDWETLKARHPLPLNDNAIEQWLASDGVVSLSANTLHLFNRAVAWVLGKLLYGAGVVGQGIIGTAATLLDRIAYLLHQGLKGAKALSEWVVRLVTKMAKALGWVVKEGMEFTESFVRRVLQAMSDRVYQIVRQTVERITNNRIL